MMEGWIVRSPRQAAAVRHDLVVIGGGLYGVMAALEAARRGLVTALVERADFGGATSANSLRIVQGGLRFLRQGDLRGHRTAVAERRWLLTYFPDLVRPLPCLLPLGRPGGIARRPAAQRLALAADRLLARRRNDGVPEHRRLPDGRLLDPAETRRLAPGLDGAGLAGGALWFEATVPAAERLVVEVLRWACRCGARALNYTEAEELVVEDGRVAGVRVRDRMSGELLQLRTRRVLNCTGPGCRQVAERFDRDLPGLFAPVLAFNLLLDRPPAAAALALDPPRPGAPARFLVPSRGKTLAGTCHRPRAGHDAPAPTEDDIAGFLAELDDALPSLALRREDVLRVDWGLLPAARPGAAEPAGRPVLHDHGAHGGPRGLLSVAGVELTTARAVAEQALGTLWAGQLPPLRPARLTHRPAAGRPLPLAAFLRLLEDDQAAAISQLRRLVRRESVVTFGDLLRRTGWGREHAEEIWRRLGALFAGEEPAGRRPRPTLAAEAGSRRAR